MIAGALAKKVTKALSIRAILTLSKRQKLHLVRSGIDENIIHVVYSGVDIDKFLPRSESHLNKLKEELGFNLDDPIILYYGPLNSLRGTDELIKAIPRVLAHFPETRFVFLSRTTKNDYCSMKSRRDILSYENTHLVEGVLRQEQLLKYLAIADIIVLPFRFWPFIECPLTVLESMALAKPLITSYSGAIPEIVKNNENGVLINPYSREIAKAILTLLRNRNLAVQLGVNARKCVEKYYSWQKVIDQTEYAFEKSIS